MSFQIISTSFKMSQKPYICDKCHKEMKKGHLYSYYTGMIDHKWGKLRMHIKCMREHSAESLANRWSADIDFKEKKI